VTAREVLDGIKANHADITPGEWWTPSHITPSEVFSGTGSGDDVCIAEELTYPDAVFIASAPSTVARLTAAVESVLARADRLAKSKQCEDREIAEDLYAAIENALEGE
jgi:hypothetical protein